MLKNKESQSTLKTVALVLCSLIIFSAITPFIVVSSIDVAGASTTTEWSNAFTTSPKGIAVDDGRGVTYMSNNDYVIAHNSDGTEKWRISTPTNTEGIVYLPKSDIVVYATSFSHDLYALDPVDGSQIWSYALSDSPYDIDADSDNIYIAKNGGTVEKIDSSGTQVWESNVLGTSSFTRSVTYSETNNRIYAGASDSAIYALNPSDGSQIWSQSGYDANYMTSMGGYIYGDNSQTAVVKLEDTGSGATEVWNYSTTEVRDIGSSPDTDTVYITQSNTATYELHALDSDMNVKFTDSPTAGALSKPSPSTYGSTEKLYVSDAGDNAIVKLDTGQALTSTVTANITDESNNPIANANVTIEDSANTVVFTGQTNSNGKVSTDLEDGDYTLIANKEKYYKNSMSFSVVGSDTTLHMALDSKPEISGTVVESDTESKTIANATIKILQNGTKVTKVLSKSDGTFSVTVDNGTYTINVSKDTYESNETTINVTNSVDIGEIALKPKEYNLNLRVSPYMNHSDTQEYVVRFNDDTITGNVTVRSSNITLITVNQTSHKLIATDVINDTGEVNITATYTVDNHTIRDSENVTVSPMTIEYVEILSPLYSSIAISTDKTIQFLILAVVAGVGVATIINAFGGIGMMIIALIMGWIMDYIPLGVLLACLFGGIFIMMNTQLNEYRTR